MKPRADLPAAILLLLIKETKAASAGEEAEVPETP